MKENGGRKKKNSFSGLYSNRIYFYQTIIKRKKPAEPAFFVIRIYQIRF
jgi:hypothetical protein